MKIMSVKCDRCGQVADNGRLGEWASLRLAAPNRDWVADLCPPCSEQIRRDVTFIMRARRAAKEGAPK